MTTRSPFRRFPLLTILALVALGLGVTPAIVHATTITVTTTTDEYGTGSGCSLREAIHAANHDTAFGGCAAGSDADTIAVPAGTYTLTVAGPDEDAAATGDLDITTSLTITGAGRSATIIVSDHRDRVFDILGTGVTATITQVAVQGMEETGPGEVYQAISSRPGAALVLSGSSVSSSDNAIVNAGTLRLTDSEATGGSRFSDGGGIRNIGSASVLTSIVAGRSGAGGGIANDGEMTVVDSSVSGGAFRGGGVLNRGLLTLRNSTVHASDAISGGGILNAGIMTLTNSTISNNGAAEGAGIWNSGTLSINNSTISTNAADQGGEDSAGGGIVNSGGTVTLANTILAGNRAEEPGTADCMGTLTSAGYNLFGVTSGCTITGDTTGNLLGVDPRLGPLEDNGGPTSTHALRAGSPALDAGHPGPVGSGGAACEATDQRGEARPADGDGDGNAICDIGAYEREPVAVATATATPTRTASPTPTRTATATSTATSLPRATQTATSVPTATPTRTPSAQPTTGPSPQSVYLPLVVNVRSTGP